MNDFSKVINGRTLEYYDSHHVYICDGVLVPSITRLLKFKFPNKYGNVRKDVLKRASQKGTALHDAIEKFCQTGEEADLKEVRNFKFLQDRYGFEVCENELPVILFNDGKPIGAGRLDMVIRMNDKQGIADIKRTFKLDREYLAYQLNLYRLACMQSYGVSIDFLKGIHLREDTRKLVDIPINETMTYELINEYLEANK